MNFNENFRHKSWENANWEFCLVAVAAIGFTIEDKHFIEWIWAKHLEQHLLKTCPKRWWSWWAKDIQEISGRSLTLSILAVVRSSTTTRTCASAPLKITVHGYNLLEIVPPGRIGSGVRVSVSFQKNLPPRGSVRVETPRRGSVIRVFKFSLGGSNLLGISKGELSYGTKNCIGSRPNE